MKPSECLKAAKKLIENEENWIKGAYALDNEDNEVFGNDKKACKFCSLGALQCVQNTTDLPSLYTYLKQVASPVSITWFNDENSHQEVMQMFDKAIELAEKDENENNL